MSEFVIETPDAHEHFRHCQLIAALRIETRTGMSHSRGSVMNAAKRQFGIQKQTKAGVLKELERIYLETYGKEYGK